METHSLGKLSHFLPGQWNIEVGDFRKRHTSYMKEKKIISHALIILDQTNY